jgi:hypothetical protein
MLLQQVMQNSSCFRYCAIKRCHDGSVPLTTVQKISRKLSGSYTIPPQSGNAVKIISRDKKHHVKKYAKAALKLLNTTTYFDLANFTTFHEK